jgi:acetolactate synthase-1/2/3 large subunit
MSKRRTAEWTAEFLKIRGIKRIFGIIGSGNAHLFDAITTLGFTEIVCVHHEQAAVMAAGTYYRLTGTVSVALLTTGAGSTNGVTGVVSTWMDSIPVMILSGNENSRFTTEDNPLRIWGIQGYDSSAMVSKVTKYSGRVFDAEKVVETLANAYDLASSPRQGPVWIDIPMNVQATPVDRPAVLDQAAKRHSIKADNSTFVQTPTGVTELKQLLATAKRPVLWLGHGIRLAGGAELAKELVESMGAPTLLTWQACDLIDSDHPLHFGRAGIYGQRAANFVLQNSDLLICIGTRLAVPQVGYEISEFARAAKIVVVDLDPTELSKHGERISLRVHADAKTFALACLEAKLSANAVSEWVTKCSDYRTRYPWVGPEHGDPSDGSQTYMNSYRFMERLAPLFHSDQVVVTDMGTALLSGHQALKFKPPQRMMTSTGLGEMGFGLPAAIGASFASDTPREVLCLNCDGGMMMNLQELQTIAHHRLPIKIIVFNNDGYLMIKHTQKNLFQGRYSGTNRASGVSCPDFTKLGQTFGFATYQVRNWQEFDEAMPKVQADQGPVMCEVFMHPEQLFVPKLSLAPQADGTIVSPPLEDLSPILPREELRKNMVIGLHPKSETLSTKNDLTPGSHRG